MKKKKDPTCSKCGAPNPTHELLEEAPTQIWRFLLCEECSDFVPALVHVTSGRVFFLGWEKKMNKEKRGRPRGTRRPKVGVDFEPSRTDVPQREEIATILPRLEEFWAQEAEMLPVLQSFSVLLAQEETQKLVRKNLGMVRRLRSLTTDALAKRAGVSASTLGRVEAGKATMSLATLRAVAAALEVKVEVFLRKDLEEKLLAVL